MTPKEKSKDLINSFYYSLPNNGSETGLNSTTERYKEAIQCALICVDELIIISNWGGIIDGDIEENSKEYFMQVNQEIQSLNKQD